jgi:hypothetical protein
MRPHAFAYKMCADVPAPVSRDGPIVLGWAARSVATGISRYGTRAASGAGVSSYPPRPRRRALMRPSEQPKPCPKSSEPMFLAEAKLGGEMDNTILDISGSMLIITVKRRERLSG